MIPTVDGITAIVAYGPTATLFTLARNHTVQQYDINPNNSPLQVHSVQHVPANTPPTPPTTLEERKNPYAREDDSESSGRIPIFPQLTDGESSADEGAVMSPLEKIAREMDSLDALESELRDKVTPLSPTSSREPSVSSRSSGRHFRQRKYLYDRPESSRASTTSGYDGTEFSFGATAPRPNEGMSIRSSASVSSSKYRSTNLRKQILRSPEESDSTATMDLFPFLKERLREIDFRTPHYGTAPRTAEVLRREMLSVVFGWNEDAAALIRDELSRHQPGSASGVLLSKWLGDVGADSMASVVGSESMTSSDWMLLALSSIRADSQKKVGEAFVQRLLEKGDIHPAVAILLGLGEQNDAIEVYVSQAYWMEALLLCCLTSPSDWGRQSFLLRKWGEIAVQHGEPELAVRIFSCASVETTDAWFSPRAQDAVYTAQQQRFTDPGSAGPLTSPPLSPPSRSGSGRLTAKNASLKLITTFGERGAPMTKDDPTPMAVGVTPIAESALSPRGGEPWLRTGRRDNSENRTATPGGAGRRKRLPSKSDIVRAKAEAAEMATPLTAAHVPASRAPSATGHRSVRTTSLSSNEAPETALRPTVYNAERLAPAPKDDNRMPSPSQQAFTTFREGSRSRGAFHGRNPSGLAVQIVETTYGEDAFSPGPSTRDTGNTAFTNATGTSRGGASSPPLTGVSTKSAKSKAIDAYISSVEAARVVARKERAESKQRRNRSRSRNESRVRGASSARDQSAARGGDGPKHIKPAKKSPSSPIPMSPEEIKMAMDSGLPISDSEDFYRVTSPVDSHKSGKSFARTAARQRSPNRNKLHVDDGRGRSDDRGSGSAARSPSSPLPLLPQRQASLREDDTESDGRRVRVRGQSSSRNERDDLQTRRAASRSRARSSSRRGAPKGEDTDNASTDTVPPLAERRIRKRTKAEAARELEERRLSLARRPSAPAIPLPSDLPRPGLTPRSNTELGNSPHSFMPPISRSQTVDPDAMARYGKVSGTSTPSVSIGLPATPRAMRHPKYMNADPERDDAPPVPEIPGNLSSLSRLSGSMLSQVTGSNISSSLTSDRVKDADGDDSIGPLLPSTVFGMKGPQAPPRSASAPIEKAFGGLPSHPAYKPSLPHSSRRLSKGHVRKISPPEPQVIQSSITNITSIGEALSGANIDDDQQIVIIPDDQADPIILPELQHLAGPPLPPPPPTMFSQLSQGSSGVINIAIDGSESGAASDLSSALSSAPSQFPQPMERSSTTSPSMHRRGRGSVGGETFSSRMRGVAERMRSSSRTGHTKSPQPDIIVPMPYDSVLPPMPPQQQQQYHVRRESISRAKSPYEQAMAASSSAQQQQQQHSSSNEQIPIPPPPPPPTAPPAGFDGRLNEMSVPPVRSQSAMSGYRNPKEIRANMPPDYAEAGVYQTVHGGFL